jgi:DHA2 family multidrug resistance protein
MAATAAPPHAMPAGAVADPPVDRRHVLCFAAMVVGQFMAILDIQIVSSSLTKIQSGLAASAEEISWIQTSYLIADVIMIPFSGFLARWLSTRTVFVASATGFTLASIWAGMATSMPELITARVAQGFMGGAMTPLVFATAFTIFPPGVRDRTMVIMGLIVSMAPTIGPTLGGYITETLSWRWLFLINVVPGLFVISTVWRFGNIDRGDPALSKGFDFAGLIFMALFLGGLQYVLEHGPRKDWFDDEFVARVAIVMSFAGVLFFWRAFTAANPIVELRAFTNRNFAVGTGLQLLLGLGLFGSTFLVPVYLAQVRQLDALEIGIVMSIGGLCMLPMAPISNILVRTIDPRLQIGLGALIAGLGMFHATGLTKDWEFWELVIPQVLRSVGMMLIFPPVTRLALGNLPPNLMKSAASLFNLMRQLGGAVGLALLASLLQDRSQFHWQRIAENVTLTRPEIHAYVERLKERAASIPGMDPDAYAMRRLGGLVAREAQVMSFADAFLFVACGFFVMAALQLVIAKPQPPTPPPGAR